MKQKVYISIDPGLDGCVAAIFDNTIRWHTIPTVGKIVNIPQLAKDLSVYKSDDYEVKIVLEDVHAIVNAAAKSTFQFGHVVGLIEGVLAALELPYIKVAPKKWQSIVFQGVPVQTKLSSTKKTMVNDTKAMALIAVTRLFPQFPISAFHRENTRVGKIHDGIVDALCMAYYCKTQN